MVATNPMTKTGRGAGTPVKKCACGCGKYFPLSDFGPNKSASDRLNTRTIIHNRKHNKVRPTGFNKDNDKARNGLIYKKQWAFREQHANLTIGEVHILWKKTTSGSWLTPKQILAQSGAAVTPQPGSIDNSTEANVATNPFSKEASDYRNNRAAAIRAISLDKNFPVSSTAAERVTSFEKFKFLGGTRTQWNQIISDKRYLAVAKSGSPVVKKLKKQIRRKGLKLYKRGPATGRSGGERAQAKNRVNQRKLERWVMRTGIWQKELGFNKEIHYVEDCRKLGGLDINVRVQIDDSLAGRVDAKSAFVTTKAQDKQVIDDWNTDPTIKHFLVNYKQYLPLTRETMREANGSVWG